MAEVSGNGVTQNGGTQPAEPERVRSAVSWRPWGPLASLGLTLALLAFHLLFPLVVFAVFAAVEMGRASGPRSVQELLFDHQGFLVAISMLLTVPLLCLVVMRLARRRGPLSEYLGLRWAGGRAALAWALGFAVFLYLFDALGSWLGRPPVPDFMVDFYTSGEPLVLLYLALVVLAPAFEELLFRGFLIPGLAHSRLGAWGAVVVSGLLFAAIHLQYDLFDQGGVLGLGLMLGAVRVTTGSTVLALALHAGVNLVAMLQVQALVGG